MRHSLRKSMRMGDPPINLLQTSHTKLAQASLVCGAFKSQNGRVWCVGESGVRFVSEIVDAKVGLSVADFLVST